MAHLYPAIVGIDPSLTCSGIAVLHQLGGQVSPDPQRIGRGKYHLPSDRRTVDLHKVQSKGKAGASWDDRGARLHMLTGQILALVPARSLVMIEAPSYGSPGVGSWDRAGLWWSVVNELALSFGCTVIPVAPTQRMKYATGTGRADKDTVLAAVVRRYPAIEVSGNDEADALVMMAIGARLTGHPIDDLPKTHTAALDKLRGHLPERTNA